MLLGDLGRCYITLAEYVPNAEERQQLQRDGINQFATAEKERPGALMASSYELWGTTLLQLSKIQMDRQLQRSAVEFLLKAIALAPSDGRAHYNLACCYALLNEHEPAIRHLRLCLETDPLGQRRQSAAEDADLKSLRNQPEFVKLLAPRPGVGTSTPALKR